VDNAEKKIRRHAVHDFRRVMAIKATGAEIGKWLTRSRMGVDWGGSSKSDIAAAFATREYRGLGVEQVKALEELHGTRGRYG
jgi:hypothetical protein